MRPVSHDRKRRHVLCRRPRQFEQYSFRPRLPRATSQGLYRGYRKQNGKYSVGIRDQVKYLKKALTGLLT